MEKDKNKKLFSTLAKILNVKLNKINLRTNSKNLEEWDSLESLNIITFLEKKFGNKIKKLDVKDTTSVRSIIKLLKKNKIKI